MQAPARFLAAPLLTLALLAPRGVPAEVIVLKDGNKIEGEVADKGDAYEVKTKYGTLSVAKSEVKEVLKDPGQITAEAESFRKLAKGLYDEALAIDNDTKLRNRKLATGIELLEQSLKIYNKAREVFTGSEYEHLDKAATVVIQEMRLYRDKMSTEQPVAPPPPPPEAKPPAAPETKPPTPPEGFTLPDPVKVSAKKEPEKPPPPPPPAVKTPQDHLAALAGKDVKARIDAAHALAKAPAPEHLPPLIEALKNEPDPVAREAVAVALGSFDGALLAKQAGLKDLALNGDEIRKRAVVSVFKKAGTEAGLRFLVDHLIAKGDVSCRKETASALKKHKKVAIKPLIECFKKSSGRPEIQVEIIKYVGISGESKTGGPFLVSLLEFKDVQNTVLNALRKIDKPVCPALIERGIAGNGQRSRMWAAWLLRGLTGQQIGSSNAAEWQRWWTLNKKSVEAEEAKWDKADEACDWLVDEFDWTEYDDDVTGYYGYSYWYWPWRYQSSRGRPRGAGTMRGFMPQGAGPDGGPAGEQ